MTGGTEYLHNEDSPNTPGCAVLGGGGIFTLSISIVFRTRISVSFLLFTFNGAHILFDFFCFCYTRDKSEFIFVRFFLECGFCFFFFFVIS